MPIRKKKSPLPQERGFYFSQENYRANAMYAAEKVKLYARTDAGFWYCDGWQVEEKDVPSDLWPVRMVQR